MTAPASQTSDYVPGVCNINTEEIAHRRNAGYACLVIFIIGATPLIIFGLSRWFRLVLAVPAGLTAICFLQAKNKFCVAYAASGQQNAAEGGKTASAVDAAAHVVDKARAQKMNLQAAAIGIIVASLLTALPVF